MDRADTDSKAWEKSRCCSSNRTMPRSHPPTTTITKTIAITINTTTTTTTTTTTSTTTTTTTITTTTTKTTTRKRVRDIQSPESLAQLLLWFSLVLLVVVLLLLLLLLLFLLLLLLIIILLLFILLYDKTKQGYEPFIVCILCICHIPFSMYRNAYCDPSPIGLPWVFPLPYNYSLKINDILILNGLYLKKPGLSGSISYTK